MKQLRAWRMRIAGVFSRDRWNKEIAEEFESHLELQISDNLRAGMTAEEARREALMKMGGLVSAREAYRDRSTVPFLEHLASDLRFSVRQLRKRPGFAVTAVLVLALGIAASTAIFAFVDAALIQPIPYPRPATLMEVAERSTLFPLNDLSFPDFQDWRRYNTVFRSMDAFAGGAFLLSTKTGTEPVHEVVQQPFALGGRRPGRVAEHAVRADQPDTVRAQAGVRLSALVPALAERGLELPLTPEMGRISLGAMAVTTLPQASYGVGLAQLSSCVTEMKLITPQGKQMIVTEKERDQVRDHWGERTP